MPAGRPRQADPGTLYALAHHLYWELKTIDGDRYRLVVDQKRRDELTRGADQMARLSSNEKFNLAEGIERQVGKGFLLESEKEEELQKQTEKIEFARHLSLSSCAQGLSEKFVKSPGEPGVISALLDAKHAVEIRRISALADAGSPQTNSFEPGEVYQIQTSNWPIAAGSKLPEYLSRFAEEFIEARNDKRFPISVRPTSRSKQLWFLARALAGSAYGLKTRTAINLIGSVRPDEGGDILRFSKRKRFRKPIAGER